jgi:phosphatidylserine decarboxylase
MIRLYIHHYRVDMSIAKLQQPVDYTDFNRFFTRALKPEARQIVDDSGSIACPVDGTVSEAGKVINGSLYQAKGHYYTLASLLGGSQQLAGVFDDGSFATLYLSPRDYHRIHMPLGGTLLEMCYIPGRLFSVNEVSTHHVPGLFTRNERVVTVFDTDAGPMGVVLVGALFVSSIETVWAGDVGRLSRGKFRQWDYRNETAYPVKLKHGQELGRFNMGSTVIVLFSAGRATLAPGIAAGNKIRYGDRMGHYQ